MLNTLKTLNQIGILKFKKILSSLVVIIFGSSLPIIYSFCISADFINGNILTNLIKLTGAFFLSYIAYLTLSHGLNTLDEYNKIIIDNIKKLLSKKELEIINSLEKTTLDKVNITFLEKNNIQAFFEINEQIVGINIRKDIEEFITFNKDSQELKGEFLSKNFYTATFALITQKRKDKETQNREIEYKFKKLQELKKEESEIVENMMRLKDDLNQKTRKLSDE